MSKLKSNWMENGASKCLLRYLKYEECEHKLVAEGQQKGEDRAQSMKAL